MSGSLRILRQELPLSDERHSVDISPRVGPAERTIRSFLGHARLQRNASARLDVRQIVTDTATLLQNSPELLSRMPSATCRLNGLVGRRGADPPDCLNLVTNGLRAMGEGGTLTLGAIGHGRARCPT
jgi:hypothetical protein